MAAKKRPKSKTAIFDSIRKPVAPPTVKIDERRPEERVHPTLRHTKHKKKQDPPE